MCLPFALIHFGGKGAHLPRIPKCSSCGVVSFLANFVFFARTFTRQNYLCSYQSKFGFVDIAHKTELRQSSTRKLGFKSMREGVKDEFQKRQG